MTWACFLDALFFGDLVSDAARDEMLDGLAEGAEYGLGLHPGPDFGVGHGGSTRRVFKRSCPKTATQREIIVTVRSAWGSVRHLPAVSDV